MLDNGGELDTGLLVVPPNRAQRSAQEQLVSLTRTMKAKIDSLLSSPKRSPNELEQPPRMQPQQEALEANARQPARVQVPRSPPVNRPRSPTHPPPPPRPPEGAGPLPLPMHIPIPVRNTAPTRDSRTRETAHVPAPQKPTPNANADSTSAGAQNARPSARPRLRPRPRVHLHDPLHDAPATDEAPSTAATDAATASVATSSSSSDRLARRRAKLAHLKRQKELFREKRAAEKAHRKVHAGGEAQDAKRATNTVASAAVIEKQGTHETNKFFQLGRQMEAQAQARAQVQRERAANVPLQADRPGAAGRTFLRVNQFCDEAEVLRQELDSTQERDASGHVVLKGSRVGHGTSSLPQDAQESALFMERLDDMLARELSQASHAQAAGGKPPHPSQSKPPDYLKLKRMLSEEFGAEAVETYKEAVHLMFPTHCFGV